jgi:hypothetical protein
VTDDDYLPPPDHVSVHPETCPACGLKSKETERGEACGWCGCLKAMFGRPWEVARKR